MNNKKNVLVFLGQFLPNYKNGGPIQSISNLLSLGWENYTFKVIASGNGDLKSDSEGRANGKWNIIGNYAVYSSNSGVPSRGVISEAKCDIYYLNSFFDFQYSIIIVLMLRLNLIPRKPIILAPRGEFSAGALSLKSFKKRIFLSVVKTLRLYKSVTWHASTELEEVEIKKVFGEDVQVKIALDIPDYNLKVTQQIRYSKDKGRLKILFISRISRKKNLKFVIETLNRTKCNFLLDIYGPIEDRKYLEECKCTISVEIKDKVRFMGPINNDEIANVYPNYDLLFFPTLGENFGHVIFESLALGVPVLCSDTTPWNRLEEFNAGWNISLSNQNKYVEILERLAMMDSFEYQQYKVGCLNYIADIKGNKKHIEDNQRLFEV